MQLVIFKLTKMHGHNLFNKKYELIHLPSTLDIAELDMELLRAEVNARKPIQAKEQTVEPQSKRETPQIIEEDSRLSHD